MLSRLFKHRPAAPGAVYGAPGAGSSFYISALTTLALLGLWFLVTGMGWVKPLFLPSPIAVWHKFSLALHDGVANATLAEHALASLSRVFGAFALACVTAIPIGVFMGVNRFARGLFDPPIEFYRPLPPLAYLPLIIIWFGIGEFPKVYLIFLAIFAPMAIAARAGVRSVSIEQIHAAYAMGGTRGQIVRHVILKAALPEIFTGMRIGIGVGPAILTAFLISFFPIMVNIATGLATLEPELEDVLRVLGARRIDVLLKVGLPRTMPYFFASLKVAITLAFVGTTVSEMNASNEGIGYLLVSAGSAMKMPLAFAGLLVIGVMAMVMYELFARIERRTTRWAHRG